MKRNIIILILLAGLSSSVMAQASFSQGKIMVDRFQTRVVNYKNLAGAPLYDAEGSPYLVKEFTNGSVYVGKTNYSDVLIRYNAYEDVFEFKDSERVYSFSASRNIDSIIIDKSKFIVRTFESKGKESLNFLMVLDSGKMELLVKKSIYMKPPEEPKAMQTEGKPARFMPKDDVFYVRFGKGELYEVENMKKLTSLFPEHKEQVKEFVKKHKISLNDESDLIRLSEFYNSL